MKNKNLLKSMILPIGRAMKKARALLLLCTLLLMSAHAWATCPSYAPMYLTGAGTGGWQNTGTEWRLGSPASSSLADGNNFDEYCTYMWLNTNDYFGLNNNTNRYCRGDEVDQEIKGDKYGAGVFGYPGESKQKAFKYIGTTGLVRINAAGGNSDGEAYKTQGCWNPYVWVEESLETEILNGSKIMFYFGIASSWNCDWMYLCEEGDQNNDKAYKNYFKIHDDKCSSHITVAYVDANKKYYIGSGSHSGTYIKMTDNAVAGNLYSLNSEGGNNIYVNVGNKPHFATTSVTKAKGTEASTIAATAANSIFGNAFTYHYYYTTDGGSTFTKFNPADISGLASGTYTVYALGWDGHILVKSDNSVTLKITVPITLNANGGVDGAVTSVNAVNGDAASGGNIAGGSLPTKTNYVFTGFYTSGGTKVINADGEWISNVSGYTDADGKWTCTAGSTLYAHWEDQWNLKGSWDEWGTYKGMPYVSSNTYRVTLELSAGTYDFKVVKRTRGSSDVYYGKASSTFTRSTITSAKGLVTTDGATYNLHVTADIAGDYVFTFVDDASASNMKVYVKYPCFTDPAGGTIFYLNMESSLKPGSAVKAPTAADASHPGLLDLISYASIANGVAYVGNKSTSSQYGSVTTTPKIKLDNNDNSFVLIQLDCALETGDKITVSTNNDVYVTTSSTRASTYTISKSATYVCPAAFNSATSVYLWRKSNDAEISDITIERCSNPAAPTAFSTSNVMATTATFSITDAADAESYDLYYASGSPSAPTSGTTATENVTTKTPTITGLSASTTYKIWVRSVCDANHKSSWYALSGNTFKTADFEITDAGKNGSSWTKASGATIANSDIDGIISGGTVVNSGTAALDGNDTHGIIFKSDNNELTITVTGMVLPVGAVITIVQHGNSSTSKATGFKISGNSMSPETCNNGSTTYKEMTQTYTVASSDGVAGKNNFKIKWTGTNQVYLKSMKVTGCEEASCTTPTSLSISGDTEYDALDDISLTASATGTDESTTYTWYKGADWATASAADPVQAESTSGATFAIGDCTTDDAGTYWCLISNGDGCEDKVSATVTVSCLTAPSAVSSLSCSTHTTNSLTYTWTKASNASGYVAKLWDNSSCTGAAVASETLGDVATVTFSSLTPGTTYYCEVQSKGNGTVYCEDGGTTDAASGSTDSPSISTFSPADGTTVMSGTTVTINGSTSSTIYYLWGTSSAPANAAAVVSGGTAGTSGAATVTTTGISSSNTYLYAVASEGGVNSTISSASYTIDDTKPTLSSSVPANSATNVNRSGTIVLTFSEALGSVDGSKFTLTNATKGAVAIDGSDNTKVNIAYSGASYSTTVTLATAAGAVADAAGNTSAALSSISFTTKAEPTLTAISANTLYQAADMATETLTGSEAYWDGGFSSGNYFKTYGSKASSNTAKGQTITSTTVAGQNFTSKAYIEEADNTSSASDPTKGAIEFKTPSKAGKLFVYTVDGSSSKLSIKKKGESSSTTTDATCKVLDVSANTNYFINGASSKRGIYGIYYDKLPEFSSSSPANGDTDVPVSGTIVLTFDESIADVDDEKFTLSSGSISAVAVDGTDDTKVNITYSGLPGSTEVTLSVAAGAVTDAAGNTSAALSDIVFTTVATGYAITTGDHDGGTIAITDDEDNVITSAEEGDEVYLTATPNTGYEFRGWTVLNESDERVSVSQSWKPSARFTMPGEAVTVSAEFTQVNYSIMPRSIMHFRYTVQVGEAEAVDGYARAHYGDVITLAQSSIADGYHLKTWGVTKTESGDEVTMASANTFVMPAEDVTINPIVGKWYTVSFDANTGNDEDNPDPITQTAVDGAITMPAAPTKDGYTFVNWMIGGTTVAAGGSYTPTANVTAYATWKSDDCAGGGGGGGSSCATWEGDPDSYTAGSFTADDNLVIVADPNEASTTAMGSARISTNPSNRDVTCITINSSDHYITGYLSDGSEITSLSVGASTNHASNEGLIVAVFCADEYFSSDVTVQTATAHCIGTEYSDATFIQEFTPASGTKYFRIYRKINQGVEIGDYTAPSGGVGSQTLRIFHISACSSSGGASCYYVTYDGNGAAGGYTNDETAYSSGATVTVATTDDNHFSHPGYTFTGWNTQADGKGTGYAAGATFSISENTTLYAQWTPATLYFTRAVDGDWTDPLNWEVSGGDPGCIPTIEHDVVIQGKVTLYGPYAEDRKGHGVAKSVRIEFGKNVEIWTEGGLIVAEDIKAKHAVDGEYEATTPDDLSIETTILGNGTLITGEENSTTQALYKFRTKAFTCYVDQDGKRRKYYYNQYVGIPFQPIDPMTSYYSCTLYEYDANTDTWGGLTTAELQPFVAYNLLRKNAEAGDDIWLRGTLNLPGKTGEVTLECGWRDDDTGTTIDEEKSYQDYMFANSWTAPIDISSLDEEDCSVNLVQSIYMFNTGYEREKGVKEIGNKDGQWSVFPFKAGKYMKDAVIPATQAFLVTAKSSGASLTLKYGKHVYTPALEAGGANNFPTRAPKRAKHEEIAPNKLLITVLSDNTILDNMYIFEREDFTEDFDNGWDGTKIIGSTRAPQLYARQGNNKMEVTAVPEMEGLEIGFIAGTDTNSYTFEFEYLESEPLYLYDRETMEYTLIENKGTYSFSTEDNLDHARFVLTRSKSPQIATGFINALDSSNKDDDTSVHKVLINDHIYIIRGGKTYSVDGALVK